MTLQNWKSIPDAHIPHFFSSYVDNFHKFLHVKYLFVFVFQQFLSANNDHYHSQSSLQYLFNIILTSASMSN
jgi:hypothetical protein